MRFIAVGLFTLAAAVSYAAPPIKHRIDLDKPGAMEELARANPEHHTKVQRILAEVQLHRIDAVPQWLKAEFDADNIRYFGSMLKTSYPAKRYLSFTLGETGYSAVLLLPLAEKMVPVK